MWVIQIVMGALGKVTRGLVKGQEDLEIKGHQDIILNTGL